MVIYQNELVLKYIATGFSVIPVEAASKKPKLLGWQNLRITAADVSQYFNGTPCNIGVLTGAPSGGLVDVDIDSIDALTFAGKFLPPTNFKFGRVSKPASHWIYRVPDAGNIEQFQADEMIVELRGDKHQTLLPGSTHPSGELVDLGAGADTTPSSSTWAELKAAIRNIAIATELSTHWKPGKRHGLALAVAGMLARLGWSADDTAQLIEGIATACGDTDQLKDRLNCVITTYDKLASGVQITGETALAGLIGDPGAERIRRWCAPKSQSVATATPSLAPVDLSTDATAADAFAQTHQGQLIYCGEQWYRRERDVFEPACDAVMQGLVKEFLQDECSRIGFAPFSQGAVRSCLNRNRINATLDLSRAQFNTERTLMDSETEVVGCSDGHVLTLGSCPPDTGRRVVTKKLGVARDIDATCPLWTGFLEKIFNNDIEMIDFVRRAVGYTLTGSVREQCMFILIGTGANGKSTFLRTLQHLFGDYAGSIPIQTLMAQRNPTYLTNDLAYLFGKRFVTASEGERDERLAEAKIKLMTGGDRIACRFMHRDFFEYTPQFKLWLATNNLPTIKGMDHALWRRILVINFPVTFLAEQQDRSLPDRLLGELPGILNWALQGLNEWQEQRLNPPAAVTKSTTTYRDDNDSVGEWIKAACKIGPKERSTMKSLHQSYSAWCENSAIEPLDNTIFGKELSRLKFEAKRTGRGTTRLGIAPLDLDYQTPFSN